MKLYKYMSLKAGVAFLKDPCLRLTPRFCLNDPFEVCLSSGTKKSIDTLITNNRLRETDREDIIENTQNFMDSHGIVSLSETQDNLLMWSHYSDDHKGIVVELEINEENPFDLFNSDAPPPSSDYGFGSVKYRKSRDFPYQINAKNLLKVRDHYYFTKSDEWIYEKENRFLLPFTTAARILVDTSTPYGKKISSLLQAVDSDSKDVYQLYFPNWDANIMADIWFNSGTTGVMFFILLDERNIRRLFVGAKADCDYLESQIKDSSDLSPYMNYFCPIRSQYTNVMKAEIHRDRFELVFEDYNSRVGA